MLRKFSLTLCLAVFMLLLQAQNNTENALPGKWQLCLDTILNAAHSCKIPYTIFTFQKNGRFTSDQIYMTNGIRYPVEGKWKIENNALLLTYSPALVQAGMNKQPTGYFNLILLHSGLLCASGKSTVEDPGRTYYTYFQKIN